MTYNDGNNTFSSIDTMWRKAVYTVLGKGERLGSRDGECTELLGFSGTLSNIDHSFLNNRTRALDPVYAAAEFLWYLRGTQSIEMIKAYAPQYERFAEDGVAHGAYGARIFSSRTMVDEWLKHSTLGLDKRFSAQSQMHGVVEVLKEKSESRQALMSMWSPADLVHAQIGDKKDLPCTIALQFFVRKNRLHAVGYMRSNDLWLGMPYDVFAFTCFQRMIADELGLDTGSYTHHVGSLHLYRRNADKALECLKESGEFRPFGHRWSRNERSFDETRQMALEVEQHVRTFKNTDRAGLYALRERRDMMSDLLHLVVGKWVGREGFPPLTSDALNTALRTKDGG